MKANIKSFEDLDVYKKLCELHLQISKISVSFPKFELHELGSQIRRSSNSIAANIAVGWNNKHINIHVEEFSPKELLIHKLISAGPIGFAPKRKPQIFFYLSPFVPPLHEMERGIGGEVFKMPVSLN